MNVRSKYPSLAILARQSLWDFQFTTTFGGMSLVTVAEKILYSRIVPILMGDVDRLWRSKFFPACSRVSDNVHIVLFSVCPAQIARGSTVLSRPGNRRTMASMSCWELIGLDMCS